MQNKPNPQTNNGTIITFNGLNVWYNYSGSWGPSQDTADTRAIEKLIDTLGKLGIASTYYQDYDCSDRWEFIRKLGNCAFAWRRAIKRRNKRLHKKDWICFDDLLETRLLVNSGRRLQSHQLTQALKLVGQISKYQYPSFSLVDSS